MERKTLFAEVLLPLPIKGYFTYRIPFELNQDVSIGKRVIVQFGKKKVYTALIRKLSEKVPNYTPKYIVSVLDQEPIVNETQFRFWEWIADYYMCSIGEVMNVALPQGLKLVSESKIILNPMYQFDTQVLKENEYLISEALSNRKTLTISEVTSLTGLQKTIPLLKTMIDKGIILVEEELHNDYKPKLESYIRLHPSLEEDELKLKEAFDTLGQRAFKQVQLLMGLINLTQNEEKETSVALLLKKSESTHAQLKALEKKGYVEIYKKQSSRLSYKSASSTVGSIELNEAQHCALGEIQSAFEQKDVALLHGVTSSGKTEIYIKLIEAALEKGEQVLYLLPEIALTTQIIIRLQKYFGDKIGVYHSRYNKNEKVEIWNKVLNADPKCEEKPYQIILGPRSALFLPYQNLGLVIVDEEHDSSYKQFDPAPRYNARDSAIYLANLHGAKTLLGSATPSVESYYNATQDRYALVELSERFGGIQMPEILVADIKEETKRKTMHSHFSSFLIKHIEEALENKEQIILFQNRRGFSLRLECDVCNWIPECIQCDVSLTYHKNSNHLRCHYCGYSTTIPNQCPSCGNPKVLMKGFGTEKIEEELAILFPDHKIMRMDLDTTRSKNAYQRIITDFEDRKIDILVGTQMVTKGLDFDNVSIVGILNADNMLSFPDFRAPERSYQLMAQVSGRAGRKKKRGKVIIQTYNPYHAIIREVIDNDFQKMYREVVIERRTFKYPPFYRLVELKLKYKEYNQLNIAADDLAIRLRQRFGDKVLGPEYPLVSRIKNQFIKSILIKIERKQSLKASKEILSKILDDFALDNRYKSIRVIKDIDPQ